MNELTVTINKVELPIKEYHGQRVVTLKEIDAVHERLEGTARKRFNDNKKRFIEGTDFFKVKCGEVRPFFGQTPPNGFNPDADLVLITETGYLMLVKSFGDDLAWTVQRQLVNVYFQATPEQRREAARASAEMSPEEQIASALVVAQKILAERDARISALETANSALTVDKQIMQPKADYFDELVDRNLLTNFRETAKQLGVKEKPFIRALLDLKYIYRDKRGKLMPYAEKNNGLFEIKECYNDKTKWSGTQTMITPKGRETFRLLHLGAD